VISDELQKRLRLAATVAVAAAATTACPTKAPEPAKPDAASALSNSGADPSDAASSVDAGEVDSGILEALASLSTFGHDPCPGCGMGGRLPPNHPVPKAECVIGPTEPEVTAWKPRFVACYENALVARPSAGGRIIMALKVGSDGQVTRSELIDSDLKGVVNVCLTDLGKRIRLKPGPARTVVVPVFFYHEHAPSKDGGAR
jgi:hypothetical protein